MIEKDLVFESDSVNKTKMNDIKTILCGHFIKNTIDKITIVYKIYRLRRKTCQDY